MMNGIGPSLSIGFSLFTCKTNQHIFNIGFDGQTQKIDLNRKSNQSSAEKSCQAGKNLHYVTVL